jgi:hypothetical protein
MISTVQQSEQSEIVVEFVAPLGQKVFLVQYRDDLDAPEWTNVSESEGGVIVSSYKNETLRYVDKQPHDEKRFYRVLMLP